MADYYDVTLKRKRHAIVLQNERFAATVSMLEEKEKIWSATEDFAPDVIVHLAAKVVVRHSIENPTANLDKNVIGTFNAMESARKLEVQHLLMASNCSIGGANEDISP